MVSASASKVSRLHTARSRFQFVCFENRKCATINQLCVSQGREITLTSGPRFPAATRALACGTDPVRGPVFTFQSVHIFLIGWSLAKPSSASPYSNQRVAQLDARGIFHVFIYKWLFTWMFICCCNLMMVYDRSECVMGVLGTTKHSSSKCTDIWQ